MRVVAKHNPFLEQRPSTFNTALAEKSHPDVPDPSTRFYELIPKGLKENIEFRVKVRKRAIKDIDFRIAMWRACEEDVLFFFNTFLWVYEPRLERDSRGKALPMMRPFITWENQDPFILECRKWLGINDVHSEKSRGLGASWIACGLAQHDILFKKDQKISFVSRTMEACDDPEDMDSLLAKVDWSLERLPRWMLGRKDRDWSRLKNRHTITNKRMRSTLAGYAATGDVGRGGRSAWFFFDEIAFFGQPSDEEAMKSSQHVTNSRWFNSTPSGETGVFHEIGHQESNVAKIVLDWKDTPKCNRGLYRYLKGGICVAVDPENNPLLEGYAEQNRDLFERLKNKGFDLTGTIRSPWYDRECDRPGATPQSIAQELDRNYAGAKQKPFREAFMQQATSRLLEHFHVGELDYRKDGPGELLSDCEFTTDAYGRLKLWMPLNVRMEPPARAYIVAADIATGTGGAHSSNSVAQIIDTVSVEQVGEFVSQTIMPSDFADYCMMLGYWLNNAQIIFEVNGPGSAFMKRIQDRKYQNVYWRKTLEGTGQKMSRKMGWHTSEVTKEIMFTDFERVVREGVLIVRSSAVVDECRQYIRDNSGKLVFGNALKSPGSTHGDRVIALCVGVQALKERTSLEPQKVENPDVYPPYSMGARIQERERKERLSKEEVWDHRVSLSETDDFYDRLVRSDFE